MMINLLVRLVGVGGIFEEYYESYSLGGAYLRDMKVRMTIYDCEGNIICKEVL